MQGRIKYMSIRAYRVKNIEHEQNETFNLWHDETLMEFLEGYGFYNQLNDDARGITNISVKALKEAMKEVKELDSETKRCILKDIKEAEKNGEEYIQYYCY